MIKSIIFFLTTYLLLLGQQSFGQTNIVKTWWSPKDLAGVSYRFDSSGVVKFHSFTCLSQFNRNGHYTVSKDSIFIVFDSLTSEEKKIYQIKTAPPTGDTLFIIDNHKIQVNKYIYIYNKIVEKPIPFMSPDKIIGITFDSIIAYCHINDLKEFINWNYSKASYNYIYEMEIIDSLYTIKKDTILVSNDIYNYEAATEWLIRKNSIVFYDKIDKKFVKGIRKQKLKVKNDAIYILYKNRETNRILWTFKKKDLNPQKF